MWKTAAVVAPYRRCALRSSARVAASYSHMGSYRCASGRMM